MNSKRFPHMGQLRVAPIAVALAFLSSALPDRAQAQFDPTFLQTMVVRVIAATGNEAEASSGFLWQQPNQIVTSLHAVPDGSVITVECGGAASVPASVVRVLERADLVLLQASERLPCMPFNQADENKPAPNTVLHTFGYHAGARSGTSAMMTKRLATEETIEGLVAGAALLALREFGIPATNLDIYAVQEGLLPGYSGAPVVDSSRQLIGIVDGGLNKGADGYNWVIPARYLRELLASSDTRVPAIVAAKGPAHFSSGIAVSDTQSLVRYQQGEWSYSWVKTKTMSLADLAFTSDDPDGVLALLDAYAPAERASAGSRLRFDIYEDQNQGLIIAIPAGQSFEFKELQPGFEKLVSETNDSAAAMIQFEQIDWLIMAAADNTYVAPGDPRYFSEVISETLAECNTPGQRSCVLDSSRLRILDFGNGNKILKVGFVSRWNASLYSYDYYSFAVRNNVAFRAWVSWSQNGVDGLVQCRPDSGDAYCVNSADTETQLAQMLAVHLTTIAGLQSESGRPVLETEFVYNPIADDPSTIHAGYFEDGELRFYNSRGKIWNNYAPGYLYEYLEIERDADNVYLQYGDEYALVPIVGGDYYRSNDAGQTWSRAGTLARR